MIGFAVRGEPQGKGRPRLSTRGGFARAYTPAKTRSYEALIAAAGESAMQGRDPLDIPLALFVTAHYGVPKSWPKRDRALALQGLLKPTGPRNDLDNVVKAVSDALNGVAYKDDGQIVSIRAWKRYSDTPRVDVYISPEDSE